MTIMRTLAGLLFKPAKNALVLLLTGLSAVAHPHSIPLQADNDLSSATSRPARIASRLRFEHAPDRMALPAGVKMRHGHGLCRDGSGNIYFSYEPENIQEHTRTLIRFAPDGTGATLLGADNALAFGVPHGLNIEFTPDGKAFLYHAHNEATIHQSTLDGTILWSRKWGPEMGAYKPTDTVVPPGSDQVVVADGYGSSMIHTLRKTNGVYAGKSWGGLGSAHGELNCPHGITYDPRRKLLLVADRGNKRLEYFTLAGSYQSTVEVREISAPCNADVQGDLVLVPDLNGPVVILGADNETVGVVEVGELLGDRGFKHPHDAIWLANGDFVVCTWNPGRIGYFRRVTDGSH